ncbi:YiiX/YebB-like N1pC/P60 family cysteine hydrolase [Priestia sp. J2]|uniref:YiiX/YebB-like N1pC/P60 family cysteine hydrolase n=1 Tax=unclassified Priestia TaxID=2800374 RepID=UPI001E521535|nr:YiiX/YebB-like N1pC/P60 family cysteine hydrolase [Priestia sp. J2]
MNRKTALLSIVTLSLSTSLLMGNYNSASAEEINSDDYYQKKGEELQYSDFSNQYSKELQSVKKETVNQIREESLSSEQQNTYHASAVSGSMGSTGDVLTTMKGSSSTANAWPGGHAAIVVDSANTIEAYGNKGPSKDGVRYWSNNWKNRWKDAKVQRVKNSTASQRAKAVKYTKAQLYEPYNYNFASKNKTDSWYCSQLVWRAWKEQGYDLDSSSIPGVFPVDIRKSNKLK